MKSQINHILYKMYNIVMNSASASQFRADQGAYLDLAQREPVVITSRGKRRRAVLVSPEFFDRAMRALEDIEDIKAAAAARMETEFITHEDLAKEFGL